MNFLGDANSETSKFLLPLSVHMAGNFFFLIIQHPSSLFGIPSFRVPFPLPPALPPATVKGKF